MRLRKISRDDRQPARTFSGIRSVRGLNQQGYDFAIRFRKIQFGQFGRVDPAKCRSRSRSIGQVWSQHTAPEMQFHLIVVILVSHCCQMFSRNNHQSGFFSAFTNHARSRCFVRLTFAAGEFGLAGQWSPRWTHANQNLPGRFNNGNGNFGCRQWRTFERDFGSKDGNTPAE